MVAVEFKHASSLCCKPQRAVWIFEHSRYADWRCGSWSQLAERILHNAVRLSVKRSQPIAREAKNPEDPEFILIERDSRGAFFKGNVKRYLLRLAIEFVQAFAINYPKLAFSVFTARLDVVAA